MSKEKIIQGFHENRMKNSQGKYFSLVNGMLKERPEQRWWLEFHKKKITFLLGVKASDCFVDIGCGEGYFSIPLSITAKSSIGFDFTFNAFKVIRTQKAFNPDRLLLVIAGGDSIPLPDKFADKVLINHVLEHVLDDKAILEEIYRILKPEGKALIGVPLALSPLTLTLLRLRRLLRPRARKLQLEKVQPGQLVPELIGKQSHIRFYNLKSLIELTENCGFVVEKAEGVGLSLRGGYGEFIRKNHFLMKIFTLFGKIFPAFGDGVLLLIRK
jgi:ubiquinone/menaquinone biosynthesis C-methylase UbiE